MEKEGLEHFKGLLEALASEMAQALAADAGKTDIVSLDESIGRLSRAGALQSQKIAQALQGNLSVRQQMVGAALRRIEDGTYGVCLACKQPIAVKRLEAMPETPLCVNCSR
ncbi:MAG: molecular chaperone DnaK [Elusimicrobia bacterium HGW-Elusimicrobia-3]|nr:MAG: molecular chaperone DnaK [Elusimicrobia bacterium HGW-Elusimicrobia-3]